MIYTFRVTMEYGRVALCRVSADTLVWGWRYAITAIDHYNTMEAAKKEPGSFAALETLEYFGQEAGTIHGSVFPILSK